MSISIDVEIDPLKSQAGINAIAGGLDGLEDKGKSVGDALSKALAGLDAEGNAEEKIAELNRQLELEERLLSQIKAPAKQYGEQLAALDRLADRGAISTSEYAQQVTKLNQQLQGSLPLLSEWDRKATAAANAAKAASTIGINSKGVDPTRNPLTGKQSMSGQIKGVIGGELAAIAGPAAIVATGISVITDVLEEMGRRDKITKEATNSMLRYATSIEGAKRGVTEMRELSKQLNISLKESVAAYSAVRDATENLYITKKKATDITRNLGMIMQIEDRAVGDSAALLGQLQFAIDRGSISAGELQKMMKAFPPIAAIWRKEFGMTTNELLMAADNGDLAKAGLGRLVTSLADGTETVKKFSMRYLDMEKVFENADGNLIVATMHMRDYKKNLEAAMKAAEPDPIDAMDAAVRKANASLEDADLKVKRIIQAYRELGAASKVATDGVKSLSAGVANGIDVLMGTLVTGKLSAASDPWSSSASFEKRLDEQRAAMERYKSLLESIKGPAKTFNQTIDMLGGMLKSRTITLQEHERAVKAAIDAYGGGEFLEILNSASPRAKTPWETDQQALAEYNADTEAVINIQQELQTEQEKTALKVQQLNELFQKGRLDAETYEKAMQGIADAYQVAEIKAEGFMKLVEKGEEERAAAKEQYQKEVESMAQFVDQTLGEAFRAATDEFTNFCKTGEFSWSKLVESILEGLARIAAAEIQAAIVKAIVSGLTGTPPIPGVSLSGGSGTMDMETGRTMSAPFPSGGGSGGPSAVPRMAFPSGGGTGGGAPTVNIMIGDPRDQTLRTMDSHEGGQRVTNHVAKMDRMRK